MRLCFILIMLALAGCSDPVDQVRRLDEEIESVRQHLHEAETARLAVKKERKQRDVLKYEIRLLELELARLQATSK